MFETLSNFNKIEELRHVLSFDYCLCW